MSNIWKPLTSSGPIPPNIPTNFIGDNGTVAHPAANNITIYANNAANQAGSSVKFFNSGAISLLEVTDGLGNTIIGNGSGNLTITGQSNTGLGTDVLIALTSGLRNTALGAGSLQSVQGDIDNTAVGYQALKACVSANDNVAVGSNCLVLCTSPQNVGVGQAALGALTTQGNCTAIGYESLRSCTGGNNTALGFEAGELLLTGTFNLLLGTSAGSNYINAETSNLLIANAGLANENNVIRIGTQGAGDGQQNACFIAGIENNILAGSPVVVTALGQLGVGNTSSEAATLITTFSSNGSWTPNTRTKYAEFFLWGSGGGAGSGRCGVTSASGGGGGGGNGGFVYQIAQASSFAAGPYTVTVGTGGIGGISVNAITTNGNPGNPGNPSSIGSLITARGGDFGLGGTTTAASAGATRAAYSLFAPVTPSATGNGAAGNGSTPGTSILASATFGGGGGGFITGTPTIGGSGGAIEDPALNILVAGGVPVTGAAGGNGNAPVNQIITVGGTGGSGGGADGVSVSGNGGNGAQPGGGGGGGAGALSSTPSGAGGNGGDGLVIIIEHF